VRRKTKSLFPALLGHEKGQDLAEYGIALGVICAILVTIAVFIGNDVNTLWSTAQSQIETVTNAEP
jgi:Flp pilus assembly pilin Flp